VHVIDTTLFRVSNPRAAKSGTRIRTAWQETGSIGRPAESPPGAPQSAHGPQQLLHELQVHQIKLAQQNEELQNSLAQLQAAAAHYTDLFDLAPVGYFTLDRDGTITQTNLAGARLLRKEPAELRNTRLGAFVADADLPALNTFLRTIFGTGTSQSCELTLQHKGQTKRLALSNVSKHAKASDVWIHLQQRADVLELGIRDNGIGFDRRARKANGAEGISLGLLGMQFRAKRIGGYVRIKSRAGAGTEVRAVFPLTGAGSAPGRNRRRLG